MDTMEMIVFSQPHKQNFLQRSKNLRFTLWWKMHRKLSIPCLLTPPPLLQSLSQPVIFATTDFLGLPPPRLNTAAGLLNKHRETVRERAELQFCLTWLLFNNYIVKVVCVFICVAREARKGVWAKCAWQGGFIHKKSLWLLFPRFSSHLVCLKN